MSRKLVLALLPVATCAGTSPAWAAPSGKTVAVAGTVQALCSPSATNPTFNVTRTNNNFSVSISNPSSVTGFCNKATGGKLSVTSTKLQQVGSPTTTKDYTISVSGWGTPSAATYNTATSTGTSTTTSVPTSATALSFSCAAGCTTNNLMNNMSYTATLTLTLAANP